MEKFLDKPRFEDHFSDSTGADGLLENELSWKNPDAPLSEYVEAEKRTEALIKQFSIKTPSEDAP